jgi:lipopolysaccharide export system permease protein
MTEVSLQEPAKLQRNFFHTDFVKVRGVGNQFESASPDSLYKSDREMTICELQSQVERAAKTRDSAWKVLFRYERKTALAMQPEKLRPGIGAAYCGLMSALKIKTAAAAEVQDATRTSTPAAAVPDTGVKSKPAVAQDTAAKPAQAPVNAPPVYAPSTGQVVASDSMSPSIRSVLAEGTKIQFNNAQDIVDGHSVEIEKKFAIAVACFIFVLLGAPVALRFPRGGVGMTIGVSLAVFGLYYVGLIVGETLADRDILSPFWGMWSANFILGTVGLWLTIRLGSEGTTNRGSETSEMLYRLRARARHLMRRKR